MTSKRGSKPGHFGVILDPFGVYFRGLDLADTPDFLDMVDQTGRGLRSRTHFGPILDPFWGHFGVHFGGLDLDISGCWLTRLVCNSCRAFTLPS